MSKKHIIPLALAIAFASPMLAKAQSSGPNPCIYLSDMQVGAELKASVVDDVREGHTCRYSLGSGAVAFVTVIAGAQNGQSPTAVFHLWLQQAKDYAQPIHGIASAYTIGTAAMALDHGKLIRTNVYIKDSSRHVRRDASIQLLSSVLQERRSRRNV